MSDRTKKFWKGFLRQALIILVAALISAVMWYFQYGWPLAGNLKKQAEQGDIAQVTITQSGRNVTVTDPEKLVLAAGCVQILGVSLPGVSSDEAPETRYVFTFKNGERLDIGASEETYFKNGRQYAPQGSGNSPELFYKMTEGLFFLSEAME